MGPHLWRTIPRLHLHVWERMARLSSSHVRTAKSGYSMDESRPTRSVIPSTSSAHPMSSLFRLQHWMSFCSFSIHRWLSTPNVFVAPPLYACGPSQALHSVSTWYPNPLPSSRLGHAQVQHSLDAHTGTVLDLSISVNGMSAVSCGYMGKAVNPFDPNSPVKYRPDPQIRVLDLRMMKQRPAISLSAQIVPQSVKYAYSFSSCNINKVDYPFPTIASECVLNPI